MIRSASADLSRRQTLGFTAAAALSMAGGAKAAQLAFTDKDYAQATVIDAQGGFGGSDGAAGMAADAARSGFAAISLTLGRVGNGPHRLDTVIEDIARQDGLIAAYPKVFLPVRRGADLREAKASGRTGLIYNLQDTSALEGEVSRVTLLKDLGVRIVQLTYNKRNLCGDGCLEPENAGLSDFGRQVIHEINRSRVVLDLSHGGARTLAEATAACTAPPAITHTGCRDLVDNPRNVSDALMRGVAEKGGVVGIYFMSYLRVGIGHAAAEPRREDLIAHLEHAVNVCGEDHVGIGTDGGVATMVLDAPTRAWAQHHYDDRVQMGVITPGDGPEVFNLIPQYNSPRRFFSLGEDLSRRGWPTSRIAKVLGGNFGRLFSETWDA